MITFLHLTFYRWFLFPLMLLGMKILSFFSPKIRRGFESRRRVDGNPPWKNLPGHTRPIWFHCSSGEFEYAKPLILLLKQRHPEQKILVTYFSPSVEKAAKNFTSVDYAVPIPWDHPLALNAFLDYHQPKFLAVARTDTWPELVYLCHKRGIPALLFSATLSSSNSKFSNPLSRAYHRWIFSHLSKILCVADDDKHNFDVMGMAAITETMGDTRYDQVFYRLQNPRPLKVELKPALADTVFVAGSTWTEDEDVLLPAFPQLLSFGVRIILAPHEPSAAHVRDLQNRMRALGLKTVLYTKTDQWRPDEIMIVDRVGILADLYAWARFAFVGNSFKRNAIHSVMEPLAAGCVTFTGPFFLNNREAVLFHKISAFHPPVAYSQTIESARDFINKVLQLQNHPQFAELKEKIRMDVKKRTGASLLVAQKLEKLL